MPRVNNDAFYDASLEDFGPTAQGVHWLDTKRQELRFKVLTHAIRRHLSTATIVDAGCGTGDFYTYLKVRQMLPKRYIGVDAHFKMVEYAKAKTEQTILCANIISDTLPLADYYLCSGALNTLTRFETVQAVFNMARHAKKGVVFNILKGEDRSDIYNKFIPQELMVLLDAFKGDIRLIEGYLEDDFTLFLEHSR